MKQQRKQSTLIFIVNVNVFYNFHRHLKPFRWVPCHNFPAGQKKYFSIIYDTQHYHNTGVKFLNCSATKRRSLLYFLVQFKGSRVVFCLEPFLSRHVVLLTFFDSPPAIFFIEAGWPFQEQQYLPYSKRVKRRYRFCDVSF